MVGKTLSRSITEIAEAERILKSYVSRILRLALLAPDIVEAILGGWADQRVMLKRLERPLPVAWEEQREYLNPAPRCSRSRSAPRCSGGRAALDIALGSQYRGMESSGQR
jgi:hypothetical protein